MAGQTIPNVDYSKIPDRLRGMWIVVRVEGDNQEILAEGESPGEAMRLSGVSRDDLTAILTKVPTMTAISYMGRAVED